MRKGHSCWISPRFFKLAVSTLERNSTSNLQRLDKDGMSMDYKYCQRCGDLIVQVSTLVPKLW